MSFRWHSPLVGQDPAAISRAASQAPSPQPSIDPAQQRVIRNAHVAACSAIQSAPVQSGKVTDPAAIVQAVEVAGVRLGSQGAGTLLAFADAGKVPSLEQFLQMCVLTPGTLVAAAAAPAPAAPTGPGLRAAFGSGAPQSADGRGRGRGGRAAVTGLQPQASARGRGR